MAVQVQLVFAQVTKILAKEKVNLIVNQSLGLALTPVVGPRTSYQCKNTGL